MKDKKNYKHTRAYAHIHLPDIVYIYVFSPFMLYVMNNKEKKTQNV